MTKRYRSRPGRPSSPLHVATCACLGCQLYQARQDAGLTRREAAERLTAAGIPTCDRTVQRWERSDRLERQPAVLACAIIASISRE